MKRIIADKTIPYAQSAPHLPHIQLVEGEEIDLPDSIADSAISNGHGRVVDQPEQAELHIEQPAVEPESKEKDLTVESKEKLSKPGKKKAKK